MKTWILLLLTFLSITLLTPACFVVIYPEKKDVAPEIEISPKPEVPMSEDLVRSKEGDMIAQLPKEWFFVELGEKLESNVFATVVNPGYNLAAVFSILVADEQLNKVIKKDGIVALARASLERRNKNSVHDVKLTGKYQVLNAGTLKYAIYESTNTGAINSKTAVFCSQLGVYYEFTLLPMMINGNTLPPQEEVESYFNSILATMKY